MQRERERERDVSASTPSSAETSLSLSLHFYLSSPPLHFFLALTIGHYYSLWKCVWAPKSCFPPWGNEVSPDTLNDTKLVWTDNGPFYRHVEKLTSSVSPTTAEVSQQCCQLLRFWQCSKTAAVHYGWLKYSEKASLCVCKKEREKKLFRWKWYALFGLNRWKKKNEVSVCACVHACARARVCVMCDGWEKEREREREREREKKVAWAYFMLSRFVDQTLLEKSREKENEEKSKQSNKVCTHGLECTKQGHIYQLLMEILPLIPSELQENSCWANASTSTDA